MIIYDSEVEIFKDEFICEIITIAKRVFRKLGPGHREEIYRNAMQIELNLINQDIGHTESEVYRDVKYTDDVGDDHILGQICADLFISNQIVVELKSNTANGTPYSMAQASKYIEPFNIKRSLLILFPGKIESEIKWWLILK